MRTDPGQRVPTHRLAPGAVTAFACAVLIVVIGLWHVSRAWDAAMSGARDDVGNLSRSLAQHATGLVDGIDLTLGAMVERAGGDDRAALTHYIRRRGDGSGHVRFLAVLNADGHWLADSRDPEVENRAPEAGRDDLRWHREHPGTDLYVGAPRPDRGHAGPIIPFSRRFTRADGSFGGIVVAALDPAVLQGVYDGVRLDAHSAIALWRDDGRLLVRRPAVAVTDRDFAGTDFFRAIAAGSGASRIFQTPGAVDGVQRLTGYERLARHPSLIVSVGMSLDEIVERWRREALIEAVALGLAVLTLIGLGIGLERRERWIRAAEGESVAAASLFRALFDHSTDGLFVHRIEPDGTIRLETLNGRAAAMLGRPAEELKGRPLSEFLPPGLHEQVAADLDATLRGGVPHAFELRDGGEGPGEGPGRVWEVVHVPLHRPDGRIGRIFAGARDITHLREAEAAALDANRLLLMAEQMAQVGHWHVDVPSGRLRWSDEVYRIHGRDPATFHPSLEDGVAAYHPDDRAAVAAMITEAVERRGSFEFTKRLVRTDGEIRNVQSRGICVLGSPGEDGEPVVTGLFGVFSDITQRMRAEASVVSSEARYRLLADNASDLIVLGHADGRRSYISPAVTAMLGYSVEEAHGVSMREWIHPDDLAEVFRTTQGLSDARPTAKVIYRLRHKAGHHIWAEAAFRRVPGEAGDVQIVTAIRDVTERQRQARHLEHAKAQAEAGARTKAEFLANMSHELRTPLAGMLGTHDLLQSDPSLTPAQRRLVGLAQESSRSLLTIVNDILDFSKIEAGELTIESVPFSLSDLVESCRRLAAEASRDKDLAVTVSIAPDLTDWLKGDPTRIRQILLNLATNAVKFTQAGRVAIAVTRQDTGTGIPLVRIAVSDTGIGIAPDVLPRLFERFSQADGSMARRFGGTGLGLAICKRLAALMGGEIGVESRIGEGSTFWFALPLPLAQAARPQPARPELLGTAPRVRRILLAEDNRINQEILTTVLKRKGHGVTLVGNGREALAAVEGGAGFDVVLMDVQMPEMDGLEATAAIRALERETGQARVPIIALTANAMSDEIERCRSAGTDAHVAKPVHWPDLFAAIDRLCQPEVAAGSKAARVLDEAMLEMMASVVGRERIGELLSAAMREIERRVALLCGTEIEAAAFETEAHALVSLSGQLGFVELSELCRELEGRATGIDGRPRIAELREAAERARSAVTRCTYARAA